VSGLQGVSAAQEGSLSEAAVVEIESETSWGERLDSSVRADHALSILGSMVMMTTMMTMTIVMMTTLDSEALLLPSWIRRALAAAAPVAPVAPLSPAEGAVGHSAQLRRFHP
jgi:hypothetical protein